MSSDNDCCCSNSQNITVNFQLAEEVIFPLASYIALSFVLVFSFVLVVSRMLITVEITSKSDLVLFDTTQQRRLDLLVSKHASSVGAMNNIHTAIALGLMIPPANYIPPSQAASAAANHQLPSASATGAIANGRVRHAHQMADDIVESTTPARPKKSKW